MKLIYIVSYLLLILPDASLASEIQQITFTYANVSSHSCVEERSEVLRRISLRSDMELSSALCSFENSDESELIIKFRWKDLASPVYSSALGLLAGGSDGDNPVLPDFFNVYYGAFSNRESCQSMREEFEKTYATETGGYVLGSFCRKAFIGKYALHIISIGSQKSYLRHLEYHLLAAVDDSLVSSISQLIKDQGGIPVVSAVMDHWLSINYFSPREIRVGILDERPSLLYDSKVECEIEKNNLLRIYADNFQFSFDVARCLENHDEKIFSLSLFFAKKLPEAVFNDVRDYESWASCNSDRQALLTRWIQQGHSKALTIVCTKSADSFADYFVAQAIEALGE